MSAARVFTTELAARRYMRQLSADGVRFSYWARSCCEFLVTVQS